MTNPIHDDQSPISDGYHTFNELYEHRHSLMLALMSCLPSQSWFSHRHNDGGEYEGWFIAGVNLPQGPITYHLPDRLYPAAKATWANELPNAPVWDGHTAEDVVSRLKAFAGRG
jgi:hypothetical protein